MAVYRFVRRLEPKQPDVTARVETKPGEEAQVDFGYVGPMFDQPAAHTAAQRLGRKVNNLR